MKKSFKHLMASVVASALAIGTLSAVAYAADVNKNVDTWGYFDASGKNVVTATLAEALSKATSDEDITYTVYTPIAGTADEDSKMIYTVKEMGNKELYTKGITVTTHDFTCTADGDKTFTVAVGDDKDFVKEGNKVVLPKGHRAGAPEKTVIEPNTCYKEGIQKVVIKCTVCKTVVDEYKEVIDIRPHVAKEEVKVNLVAGELDILNADGTTTVVPVRQNPTCEAKGWYYVGKHCKYEDCGAVIKSTVEKKETDMLDSEVNVKGSHNWEYDETLNEKKPACEEVGYFWFKCKNHGKNELGEDVPCNNVQKFFIPATGHSNKDNPDNVDIVYRYQDPTCTKDGYKCTIFKCKTCGKEVKSRVEETIKALGHDPDTDYANYIANYKAPAAVSEKAPVDCLTKATFVLTTRCKREVNENGDKCGAICKEETVEGDVGPHTAKTDKDGYLGLLWEKEEVVPATCVAAGSHIEVNRCKVCNAVIARRTDLEDEKSHKIIDPALGHTIKYFYDEATKGLVPYRIINEVAATCETKGSKTFVHYCKRCDIELNGLEADGKMWYTTTEAVSAKNHIDEKGNDAFTVCVYTIKAPTCTEAGAGYFACSLCGKLEQDSTSPNKFRSRVIPALGHDLKDVEVKYEIIKPVTCTTAGSARYVQYCKRCGKAILVKEEQIEIPGHKFPKDPEIVIGFEKCESKDKHVAATCTKDGIVDFVWTCEVCGIKKADHGVQKKLGHLYPTVEQIREQVAAGVAYITKEPTCTTAGYGHVKCVRCNGDVYDWELGVGDTEYHDDKVLPPYGHDWSEAKPLAKYPSMEPTCLHPGYHTEGFVCNRCGIVFNKAELTKEEKEAGLKAPWTVKDPALGHAYTAENAKVVMDKDDALKGVVEFKCARKNCPVETALIREFKFTDADVVVDTASTCTVTGTGHYEVKVYADEDDYYVVKSSTIVVPVAAHVSSVPNTVIENEVKATATTEGKFDVVDYCVKCGAEINRITYTVDPTGAVENPYKDIKNNAYYTDAVVELYDRGIMTGTAPEIFGFNKNLERQDLVTLLYRLNGESAVDAANDFADVKAGKYYTNAVIWAKANGIVTGYTKGDKAGQFGVGDKITRQDFVKILYGYAVSEGLDVAVNAADSYLAKADASSVSSYAVESINWGYENGLIGSGSDLRPLETITRQDAATIIARFLNLYNI